ncbi:glycosyltransferase [Pseudothermotoga thermarum]|uniref:Glycosyl transferase group 1 n=1 Tax=Pseudothermotoga thermarum DSM 5069 TaxID=688269 RepID=F7YXD0_9THEM|nr:glycosyltransferase [Pseudothermotoga thermarum]AEH51660.1 glycosyl transferase group 1 [Pseudothermotoga thermarum DSM 5069]
MKILFITNLFPMKRKHSTFGASFIEKRLIVYKQTFGVDYDVVITWFKSSWTVNMLRKILRKHTLVPTDIAGKTPIVCDYTEGLIEVIKRRIGRNYEKQISVLEEFLLSRINLRSYDLIYAHGMYEGLPAGIIAMRLSKKIRKPYVVHLHGSDINYCMPKNINLYLQVLENASKCVFVSNKLLEKAKSMGYSGKNAVVTGNGYDPNVFKPMDKNQLRREFGIYNSEAKYVGFVGSLSLVKRADKLPEIFRYIANEGKNVKFIIVGDGPLRKKIEKEMKGLDYIITGIVPHEEVAKWMNTMDVMILPSRNEGFGAVLIEAQACGVITIGSKVGGIPEAIGFEDLVVPEGENFEKRFAEKVVEILKNGYNISRLIDHAQNYTWKKIVEMEYQVCERTVQNNRSELN